LGAEPPAIGGLGAEPPGIDMSERPTIPRLAQPPVFTDAEPDEEVEEEREPVVAAEEPVSADDADDGAAADVSPRGRASRPDVSPEGRASRPDVSPAGQASRPDLDDAPSPAAQAGGWAPPSVADEPYEIPKRKMRGPLVIAAALFALA